MKQRCRISFAALLCLVSVAHADSVSVTIGQDISDGDFGAETESSIGVTSFGARLQKGDWSFRASSGYIDLGEEPDTVIAGPRGRELVVESGEPVRGFTDLILGVSGLLLEETEDRPAVFINSSVKLPTADDEQGLGTGATDFSTTVELSRTFNDVIGYVYLGGRLRGESDVIEVQNSLSSGIGLQKLFGSKVVGSLGYDYRGASFVGGEDAHEVTALVSYKLTKSTALSGYVYTGFTEVSPDLGGGLMISQKLASW